MKVRLRRKRRHFVWPLFLLVVVAIIVAAFPFVFSVLPQLAYQNNLTQAAASPIWPDYGSGAVRIVGEDTNITEHGSQSSRPIASITKVITALVVLDRKPLDINEEGPSIELSQADLDIYNQVLSQGAAVQPVTIGSTISERQAIQVMMLPSSCNYAETLARWAYGSEQEYLFAANSWLAKNGFTRTKVVDASGLSPENVSAPSDLLGLGQLAMQYPALATIVGTKQASVDVVGDIMNSNQLLGQFGIDGIKTGWTDEAGACLLFSGIINVGGEDIRIVGVLLGGTVSSRVASDVAILVNSIRAGFHLVQLVAKGQVYGTYKTVIGQSASLIAKDDINATVWSDTSVDVSVNADKVLFITDNKQKGSVEITVGGKIYQTPLFISVN